MKGTLVYLIPKTIWQSIKPFIEHLIIETEWSIEFYLKKSTTVLEYSLSVLPFVGFF